jgi:hypothetical protein
MGMNIQMKTSILLLAPITGIVASVKLTEKELNALAGLLKPTARTAMSYLPLTHTSINMVGGLA